MILILLISSKDGYRALSAAASSGLIDIVKLLLAKGVKVDVEHEVRIDIML